jgi:hypothetical protein
MRDEIPYAGKRFREIAVAGLERLRLKLAIDRRPLGGDKFPVLRRIRERHVRPEQTIGEFILLFLGLCQGGENR